MTGRGSFAFRDIKSTMLYVYKERNTAFNSTRFLVFRTQTLVYTLTKRRNKNGAFVILIMQMF